MEDNLAVLGCGRMGEILAVALKDKGVFRPEQITVTARSQERLARLEKEHGFRASASNDQAAGESDIVLLAVKPKDVPEVLAGIARTITRRHLFVSIAAGVTTSSIEAGLPMAGPILRAMPNVAARVGEGMTALAAGDRAGEIDIEKGELLFSSVGKVVRVAEHALDAVTAVSGSGPAFLALVAEAMVQAASGLGLAPSVAGELVGQTVLGTGALLVRGGMDPGEIRRAVTSPGGTTEAGIGRLEATGTAEAIKGAVRAAAERARELSN